MKFGPWVVVVIAVLAGGLGVFVSLFVGGPGPLLGTDTGQRLYNDAIRVAAAPPPEGVTVARRGAALPVVQITALEGPDVRLPDDYAGQPLLINLWASWCGPCIEEMPELDRFAREQGANGVQVLGIALDDAASVRAFLDKVPVSYRIAIDAPGAADAGVRLGNPRGVLPYTALISADGQLLKQRIGPFAHGEIDAWVAE